MQHQRSRETLAGPRRQTLQRWRCRRETGARGLESREPFFVPPPCKERGRDTEPGIAVAGIDRQGFPVRALRRIVTPCPVAHCAQCLPYGRVAGVTLDDAFERHDRIVQATFERIRECVTRAGDRMIGLAGQHAFERSRCDLRVAVLIRELPEVDCGLGVGGQQLERLFECASGIVAALQPVEGDTAIVVRLREIGLESDRTIECGERVRGTSCVNQREAEIALGDGIRGHQRDGALQPRNRRWHVATRECQYAGIDQDCRIAVISREQPRVDRFGVVESSSLLELDGAGDRAQRAPVIVNVTRCSRAGAVGHARFGMQARGDGSKACRCAAWVSSRRRRRLR